MSTELLVLPQSAWNKDDSKKKCWDFQWFILTNSVFTKDWVKCSKLNLTSCGHGT